MLFKCKCKKLPFHYLDYEVVSIGENSLGEASIETCKACGTAWLKFLIEEPHYSNSGRWWRTEIVPSKISGLTIEKAKEYIEEQEECFAGGSFYAKGIHKMIKPICVQ